MLTGPDVTAIIEALTELGESHPQIVTVDFEGPHLTTVLYTVSGDGRRLARTAHVTPDAVIAVDGFPA